MSDQDRGVHQVAESGGETIERPGRSTSGQVGVVRTDNDLRVAIVDGIGLLDGVAGGNRHENGKHSISLSNSNARRPYRLSLTRDRTALRTDDRGTRGQEIREALAEFFPPGALVERDRAGRPRGSTISAEKETQIVDAVNRELDKKKFNLTGVSLNVEKDFRVPARRVREIWRRRSSDSDDPALGPGQAE